VCIRTPHTIGNRNSYSRAIDGASVTSVSEPHDAADVAQAHPAGTAGGVAQGVAWRAASRKPHLSRHAPLRLRGTTSPVWQHSQWAGNVTEYRVKGVSTDNVFFGVQAVDSDGNVSVASYPLPMR